MTYKRTIQIAKDFTETPTARYREDGRYSGQEFREDILEQKFIDARESNEKLLIDLDGGYGYATSFLEEAFGGLARKYSPKEVQEVLVFKSDDEPELVVDIIEYINDALNKA